MKTITRSKLAIAIMTCAISPVAFAQTNINNTNKPFSNKSFSLNLSDTTHLNSSNFNNALSNQGSKVLLDVNVLKDCNGISSCKVYNGDSQDLQNINLDFFSVDSNTPVSGSFGYEAEYGQESANNTVIVNSPKGLTGVIRGGVDHSYPNKNTKGAYNNKVFVNLNSSDTLDFTDLYKSHNDFYYYYAGGTIGGGVAINDAHDNLVYVSGGTIKNGIIIGGTIELYQNYTDTYNPVYLYNNQVVINNSKIISDRIENKTITGLLYIGDQDDTKRESILYKNNGVQIDDSYINVESIVGSRSYIGLGKSDSNYVSLKNTTFAPIAYSGSTRSLAYITATNPAHEGVNDKVTLDNVLIDASQNTASKIENTLRVNIMAQSQVDILSDGAKIIGNNVNVITTNKADSSKNGQVLIYATNGNDKIKNASVSFTNSSFDEGLIGLVAGYYTTSFYSTNNVDVKDNSLYLKNVAIKNTQIGAAKILVKPSSIKDPQSLNVDTQNNNIHIVGGNYQNTSVFGAYILQSTDKGQSLYNGQAINNTITIEKSTDAKAGSNYSQDMQVENNVFNFANLYGGYGAQPDRTFLGNTLNLKANISTVNFGGFQNINFYLGDNWIDISKPALSITGKNNSYIITDENAYTTNYNIFTKGALPSDKEIVLVYSKNGFTGYDGREVNKNDLNNIVSSSNIVNYNSIASLDILNSKNYELSLIDSDHDGTDDSIVINPNANSNISDNNQTIENPVSHAFMQNSLSHLTTMYASDELLADTILANRSSNSHVFAASRYNNIKYDTGSNVKDKTFSALLGFNLPMAKDFSLGFYGEYGNNDYETSYDSIIGSIEGSGTNKYYGIGFYADALNINNTNWYTTAYIKAGKINSDYEVNNQLTNQFSHDLDLTYVGVNAKIGYLYDLNKYLALDSSLSYFYDYINSDSAQVDEQGVGTTTTNYDAISSHRLQGMFKLKGTLGNFNPYVGLGYEYTMGSDANGSSTDNSNNINFTALNINGGSGLLELGSDFNISNYFTANVSVKGFAGVKDGSSISANLKYSF